MNHQWDVMFISDQSQAKLRMGHYFRGRKNFECINDSFEYFNLDTGVHFFFSCSEIEEGLKLSLDLNNSNSNTIREALNEISPLIKKFNLKVVYPEKIPVEEDYIIKRFIQKWHQIKRDYLDYHYDNVYYPVPTKKVKSAWYWNYSSQWTSRFLKDMFSVPKIQFFNQYGKAHSVATVSLNEWVAVPEAEFYILRQTLNKGLFRNNTEVVERLVSRKAMDEIFSKCRFLPFEKTPFYKFRPEDFKSQLKAILNSTEARKLNTLEPGRIIDKEIYDGNKIKQLEESTY
ncbi:MAG: hypothetical protein NE327_10350 [Lentisphaeraceae bacterium]|nr:hypothetical protein [Lentisphaeraceae bacterium]